MEQLPELIFIDGVLHSLYTTPLLPWIEDQGETADFDKRAPNCERGYIGKWKIEDENLLLIGLYAWRDGEYTGLRDLFNGQRTVAADWSTGPLVVEPASSEIPDGANPKVRTLFVEAGRVDFELNDNK